MGQIEDLRLFVTVVDQGSIARAAAELGIVKSAVSRRLGQLEARYDVHLINRHPGLWRVTAAGRELYERALPLVADADDLDTSFTHASYSPKGPLRLTIAREFGQAFLGSMLLAFTRSHPDIDLTLDFDDRVVDLERDNYDLALRITPQDTDKTSRQDKGEISQVTLGTAQHGLYASPAYLARQGTPQHPTDLDYHAVLNFGATRRPSWTYVMDGKPAKLEFKPALNSNSGPFLKMAALQGDGLVRFPDFVVAEDVATGRLIQILPQCKFPDLNISITHARTRRLNRRIRAFIAAAQQHCAGLPS